MSPSPRPITFAFPSFQPAGGIVKIMDYLQHAQALGHAVRVVCPKPFDREEPLFQLAPFRDFDPASVPVLHPDDWAPAPDELFFFSWPGQYALFEPHLGHLAHEQAIHIIQNVRHANPVWKDGYPLRLLTRPMARIVINDVVLDAIRPWLNRRSLTTVVPLGHRWEAFSRQRDDDLSSRPLRVAYTTWKSDVGEAVERRLASDRRFAFESIRDKADWDRLRRLYHGADVFLCCPLREEGFYLPALEAMSAGCVVVTPDAGGNMAFCRFGENCVEVGWGDAADYEQILLGLLETPAEQVRSLRAAGYATCAEHALSAERDRFAAFLTELEGRLVPS